MKYLNKCQTYDAIKKHVIRMNSIITKKPTRTSIIAKHYFNVSLSNNFESVKTVSDSRDTLPSNNNRPKMKGKKSRCESWIILNYNERDILVQKGKWKMREPDELKTMHNSIIKYLARWHLKTPKRIRTQCHNSVFIVLMIQWWVSLKKALQ